MSVVGGDDMVSLELNTIQAGVDCEVKVGRKVWPGKVAAVGKLVY